MAENQKDTTKKPIHPLTERFREIKRQNIERSKKYKEEFLEEKTSREKQPEKKIANPRWPEAEV